MAPPRISNEEIIEIQSLYDKGFNIPQIEEKTGKSSSVIDRYIKAERIKPKIPAVPQTEETKSETKTEEAKYVTLKAAEQPCPNCRRIIPADAKLCPYCGATIAKEETTLGLDPALDPWDWFKKFLESYGSRYGVKRPFIELNCDRVRMRKGELPLPVQLAKDLTIQQPGIKVDTAAYIAEVYGFHLNEYKARRQQLSEYWQQPYQGIQIPVQQPVFQGQPYQGVTVPMQSQPQGRPYPQGQPYQGVTVPMQSQPQQYANPMYAPPPYPRLESELERYGRIQQLFQKTEERNPVTDRLEKENDTLSLRLQEMENSIKNQMLAENQQLRTQVQQQGQAMRQYEDNLRDTQLKLQFEQSNKRTTEEDVKMKEADHKYTVDMKKLDEGGKTREAIANAVKTGFSQVGQAIFATAQELGSEEKRPMQGVTDTKNLWQSECPFCQTTITAPLSARVLTCPGCGRQLEVTPPTSERQIERPPPKTIEQPPLEQTPLPPLEQPEILPKVTEQAVGPPRVSECPFCKTQLTIPTGLDMVECPQCKKRLRVEAEPPIIEQETLEPPVGPEQQVIEQEVFKHPKGTHIEVPKEIHIESPPPPEIITETQPVKDQIIEQPIVPEPERFPKQKPKTVIEKQAHDMKVGMEKQAREEAKELKKLRQRNEEENEIKREKALKKVAEGIAIGEGVKKVEEELKKKEPAAFSKDGYTLYETKSRGGTPFYYFAKQSDKGKACTKIPDGYEISKNQRSGVPNLKKKKGGNKK